MEEKTKSEQKKEQAKKHIEGTAKNEGKPLSKNREVMISLVMLAITAIFILALVFARHFRG